MSARKSIVTSITVAIQTKLDLANGRRWKRTINYREAIQAIRESLQDDYGYVNGGTVEKSDRYSAIQTKVTAIAGNGAVIVSIFSASASSRSGTGLPWTRAANEEKIKATINSLTCRPYRYANDDKIRMSRKTARAIVAAQDRADAIDAAERIPVELRESEILVTVADSLAAGNCESETHRIQSWFPGRESVPAKEILSAIVIKAPSLVYFAVRAVQYAQRRAAAL